VATPQNFVRLTQKIDFERADLNVEEYRKKIAEGIPQKRFVTSEEIAALAVFLCRDEAFGITGEDITVAADVDGLARWPGSKGAGGERGHGGGMLARRPRRGKPPAMQTVGGAPKSRTPGREARAFR
jgi:hypothetical protein